MNKQKYKYIGITLDKIEDADLIEMLDITAEQTDRSLNWTIRNILEQWKEKRTQI